MILAWPHSRFRVPPSKATTQRDHESSITKHSIQLRWRPGDLITTGRLSQYLGCSERHIFNLRRRGLPALEIGDMVRFDLAAVRLWLATQRRDASHPQSA
jgi:phosphopantetheinyl transferase